MWGTTANKLQFPPSPYPPNFNEYSLHRIQGAQLFYTENPIEYGDYTKFSLPLESHPLIHYLKKPNFHKLLKLRQDKDNTAISMSEMDEEEECNGMDNLLNDFGIWSLVTSILGAILGIATYFPSELSILVATSSVLITGGPSALIAILDLLDRFDLVNIDFAGLANTIILVDFLSIVDKLLNTWVNIPGARITNFFSGVGDLISVFSISLGLLTLFPEEFGELMKFIFGEAFVENYGCNNPYRDYVLNNFNITSSRKSLGDLLFL